ncbi:hypothetical protein KHA80_01250 [Anaerobacillus sp. HL2]|nr:hypothetical protein KHA80_01250 [Anaerobacillus sp. HL2]
MLMILKYKVKPTSQLCSQVKETVIFNRIKRQEIMKNLIASIIFASLIEQVTATLPGLNLLTTQHGSNVL